MAAVVGAAAVFGWDWFTDRMARGQDAATVELIEQVLAKNLQTDSGKPLPQLVAEMNERAIRTETKVDVLVDAISALAE